METIIEIKGIEEIQSQKGVKYHKIKTDIGTISVFEDDIVKELKKCDIDGLKAKVEIVEVTKQDKVFKNIRKFIEATDERVPVVKPSEAFEPIVNKIRVADPTQSMYTSYTKDVFIELMSDTTGDANAEAYKMIMQQAIALVKQAKEAFE